MADDGWTDDELAAALTAYLSMLDRQERGEAYSKAEARRTTLARPPLQGRSEGSFEFRMQNISSLLQELSLPWIEGYKPAAHLGTEMRGRLLRLLREARGGVEHLVPPTDDPAELATRARAIAMIGQTHPPAGTQCPERRPVVGARFVRDPAVVAWVLRAAQGRCELCGAQAPFRTVGGEPYLEVHHVHQLADGGADRIDNAVALCPNCHRRCHYAEDAGATLALVRQRVPRLVAAL